MTRLCTYRSPMGTGSSWGRDDAMKLSQNRQAILELFEEKERPLSIDEILKGLSRPRDRYQAVRQTLHRMVQDEQIVRLRRGSVRGIEECFGGRI